MDLYDEQKNNLINELDNGAHIGQIGIQYGGQYDGKLNKTYNNQINKKSERPMSLSDWIITLIILMIPIVGFIMLFVWAFRRGNISKKNFCRAYLILLLIFGLIGILFYTYLFSTKFVFINRLHF